MTAPLLEVEGLTKEFALPGGLFGRRRRHRAVDGVSFTIGAGETFGLIGESGSGKSTIGRMIARLITPSSGTVRLAGQDWLALRGPALRQARPRVQMVFQSSYASLDPRWVVDDLVAEPLRARRLDHGPRVVAELLLSVGLDPSLGRHYPHQLSGGQRQRVAIARAIAPQPDLLIADEPVSALDVSVQAQVLGLLRDIRVRHGLAMLFISHDLAVVSYLSDRVGVLAQGRLVETAHRDRLFRSPRHPTTQALIDAIPGSRHRGAGSARQMNGPG